jgi:CRP-like cAMP-binding protein
MCTVLVIESNSGIRERIAEVLQSALYTVVCANSTAAALHVALNEKPEVILCSLNSTNSTSPTNSTASSSSAHLAHTLPVDAFAVLQAVRTNTQLISTSVMFFASTLDDNARRHAMNSGADDVLTFPCSDAELLEAVSARVRRARDMVSAAQREDVHEIDATTLRRIGRTRTYKKNDVIYTDNSAAHAIYYVVHGKVKTYRTHELGKDFITGLYADGQFVGYSAALSNTPHTDVARALDESEIIEVPRSEFLTVVLHSAVMSQRFLQVLADELNSKDESLVRLAYNSVRKRVADALVALEQHYHDSAESFRMAISRENLANLAGTATETTIRTLHDFKEEKLIEIHGSTIQILNLEKLRSMRS